MVDAENLDCLLFLVLVMRMGLERANAINIPIAPNGPTFDDAVCKAISILKNMGAE